MICPFSTDLPPYAYSLPQIFYTITMAEDKWPQLREILESTDNNDILPTNRPLHVYMFYRNYLNNIRSKLWKNQNLARWGKWEHYFEHDEFQNRGTIHTHSFAYTKKKIPELIHLNLIRVNVPDPNTEPELYRLVTIFQIHYCDHKCGGPTSNGEQCSKGFSQPLSQITYCSPNTLRYVYRHTKEEDRMVIPYHPETLLIWREHINFQYITITGFAKYITKYVTKAEPSELFDIDENDEYR
ncbi:7497_t:CDS:1 [Ambispora leptoticha]|uniref:7497_t:CDS:1 n=1 Tax=Ambispora leptoticha TaxID=144679 RepID=A0A9N9IBT6_9GLOM|nr:7497_t:CDS:1 [Ambispora leptoticha]